VLKKLHRPCSSFFLAVVLFTALIIPAWAVAPAQQWTPAYTADLANPKTTDNDWWISVGQAKIADGKMTITPGKHGGPEAFLYSPRFPRSARMEPAPQCRRFGGNKYPAGIRVPAELRRLLAHTG
jgi:hypothetical protein